MIGSFLLAVTLLSTVTATRSAQAGPGVPVPKRVLVIGDSIILGTQGNIAADLPDWDVVFDAAVSRSTDAGLAALAAHGTDFSVVVVALGANDGETPGVFTPRVAALLDALAGVPHVVWLTVHEARPYYARTNAIIRDQVARHPNAIAADWNAAVRPGDVGGDGLHLTGQGAAAMAGWVAAVVRLVSVPPTTTTTTTTTTSTTTTTTTTTVASSAASTAAPRPEPRSGGSAATGTDPPHGSDDGPVAAFIVVAVAVAGALVAATAAMWRRRSRRPEL